MKNIFFLIVAFPMTFLAQEISGEWKGTLEFGGQKIELSFAIEKDSTGLIGSMDIPVQGVKKAKAGQVLFSHDSLEITFPQFNISYKGSKKQDSIYGNFTQNGFKIPLALSKGVISVRRPQTPSPPFNYSTEEVVFTNAKAQIKLQGTLSLPNNKPKAPIVIIISGSGPQNRNGDLFGHLLYYVIADHLSEQGVGVLRFDERGVGDSQGQYNTGDINTFSEDVAAAIEYLKSRKSLAKNNIGLLGHSLGGIIAAKLASENKQVNFLVLMAAAGVSGDLLMLKQKEVLEEKMGVPLAQIEQGQALMRAIYDLVRSNKNQDLDNSLAAIDKYLIDNYGVLLPETQKKQLLAQLGSPEILSIIRSDPSVFLEKISIPVLAMNGSKDLQVSARDNLLAIEKAIKPNPKNKIITLEGLNHLFQEAETGAINEYYTIEQTISPKALFTMSDWILQIK